MGRIEIIVVDAADIAVGVGEGSEFEQVLVIDVPVELAAPEAITRLVVGISRAIVVGVARGVVATFVHEEEKQLVLHERAGCKQVELGQRVLVLARCDVAVAVGVVVVLGGGLQGGRFSRQLGAVMEFIGARAGHGIDHATGAATEFDGITASLDLKLLVERERCA